MKLMGRSLTAILPLVLLAGCTAPRQSENPRLPNQRETVGNQIGEVIVVNGEGAESYEFSMSNGTECRVRVAMKWPRRRLNDENYASATTFVDLDLRAINSPVDEEAQAERPLVLSGISLIFSVPQRYQTMAVSLDGKTYEAIGFIEGFELPVSKNNLSAARKALGAMLRRKKGCFEDHGELALRDFDSYTPEEQFQLGEAYFFSIYPGPKPGLAYPWYEKAAQRGNMKAQLRMGSARRSGLHGVSKDVAQARYWFELAAAQGSPLATDMLGEMYEKGTGGVSPDLVKAASYYRRAADQGVVTAQESLADMLRLGKGVAKNITEARILYHKAAAAGSDSARAALRAMEADKTE